MSKELPTPSLKLMLFQYCTEWALVEMGVLGNDDFLGHHNLYRYFLVARDVRSSSLAEEGKAKI